MITPTVGRIVWFFTSDAPYDPLAAIVTKAWNNHMVNLCVFDADGFIRAATSVDLLQDDAKPEGRSSWCEWMPYQKGQATKTEALEAKLAS